RCLSLHYLLLFHHYSFFFQSYRPPRHLHSFPTRRSSDLAAAVKFRYQHNARFDGPTEISLFDNGSTPKEEPYTRPLVLKIDAGTDRKSTRLNSSHSQISYAVFCLKKKKKKQQKIKHTNET